MRLAVPVGVGFGIVLVFASLRVPVGQKGSFTCLECGLGRHQKIFLGKETLRDVRTARTDWYDRRRGGAHEHRWIPDVFIYDLNIWQTAVGYRSPVGYESLGYEAGLWRMLLRLERLDLDVEYHRELTHPDRDHRRAAQDAYWCFDPRWNDEAVHQWWDKTRKYLADPSMWTFEFMWWTHPFDRIPRSAPPDDPPTPPPSRP